MTDYSIFFIIAVAATGVGALLFLLSLFGLGEHDLDFDADAGGADVGLLSIKSGIGFFLGFGWGGVLAQGLGWGMAASLASAFFTGVLMFLIIGLSMRFIMSLKSDGTLNYETLKGMHGTVYANYAANECDLLLAFGARFDDRVTGNPKSFAVGAKIVHVDIDDSEINKNKPADLGAVSYTHLTLPTTPYV